MKRMIHGIFALRSFCAGLHAAAQRPFAILAKAAAYADQRKIDPTTLLQGRLYPDMLPLVFHIQAACNHARRGTARLSGAEPTKVGDNQTTFADLQALIRGTVEALEQVDPTKWRAWRIATSPSRLEKAK